MSQNINLRAIINKANGQISASFPKKKMPQELLDLIKKKPSSMRILKIKLEGFE